MRVSPEVFMGSLHDGSSRVCLGALDGVAVADGVEDLKDTVFGQFVDLLHLHPLQWVWTQSVSSCWLAQALLLRPGRLA